jgi:hypothetical protein
MTALPLVIGKKKNFDCETVLKPDILFAINFSQGRILRVGGHQGTSSGSIEIRLWDIISEYHHSPKWWWVGVGQQAVPAYVCTRWLRSMCRLERTTTPLKDVYLPHAA